jgi:peptide/nickel transport system ATP-binding protein
MTATTANGSAANGFAPFDPKEDDLLVVQNLRKHFPIQKGFFKRTVGAVKAVDGVSFRLRERETLGLVGESGCGKTTTSRLIMRGYPATGGTIHFKDRNRGWVDIARLDNRGMKPLRRHIQMVFQDPYASLNPRMTLLQIVGEPLLVNGVSQGQELKDRVADLLRVVGLRPEYMVRYPHAFSGGQRQRIGIARALALRPQLVVCDEPVSALDVSIQAQILHLLMDLRERLGLSYLFICHDLAVVRAISDRVAVMYLGQIVEEGAAAPVLPEPAHP